MKIAFEEEALRSDGGPAADGKANELGPKIDPLMAAYNETFWVPTGVNAYDLVDGNKWQVSFGKALQETRGSKGLGVRPLRRILTEPESCPGNQVRELARHQSDPEARADRAAHNEALAKMQAAVGKGVGTEVVLGGSESVALFRFGSQLFAVSGRCPHQRGNLADGEVGDIEDMVLGKRRILTCPLHKMKFDIKTGSCVEGTCGNLRTYKTRIAADEWGRPMVEVGFDCLPGAFFDTSPASMDLDDF